jgi:nucleoside-diphosphate-sugar epimerase
MRVFVTGATGFIGSAIVPELIGAGHEVLGLTRSDAGAKALAAVGAEVHRGDLGDIESLRAGAEKTDAVIHLAFVHDFSNFAANCETDRRAIEAMGDVLVGSDRMMIVTSGTGIARGVPGVPATEDDPTLNSKEMPRAASEEAVDALVAKGGRVAVVRLPQVHNTEKQGLITYAIHVAREKGVCAYVGDGQNRWPAAHRLDTARLYRLVLEKGVAGARYNSVAEEGVAVKDICETVGKGLNMPVVSLSAEEAPAHFGWLAWFIGRDSPASSKKTRAALGWEPTGPGLIEDLRNMRYSV